jgi:competence protein ComEC
MMDRKFVLKNSRFTNGPTVLNGEAIRRVGSAILSEHERWFLWAPVLLGIGVGGYFTLPIEPASWAAPIAVFVCALTLWRGWENSAVYLIAGAAGLMSFGVCVAQLKTNFVAAPVLVKSYGPGPVSGKVVRLERLPRGPRVVLEQVKLRGVSAKETPHRVRIRLHPSDTPVVGETLDLFAKLSPPGRPSIPGGFDFQRRFWFMGIGGVGFTLGRARTGTNNESENQQSISIKLRRFRLSISDRIRAALPGESGAVAAALITGDRSAISQGSLSDMRDAGLAHLLAISGLHLGLVATILFFVTRAILATFEPVALRWPIKKIAAIMALIGAFGYLMMTGGTIPTQRAFLMTGLALLAITMDRSPFSLRLVAFGAFSILLIAPEALLGASFQMSFAAVVALVAAYETFGDRFRAWIYDGGPARRASAYLLGVALTTVIASAATGVFAAHQFGRIAYYGLAANLLAVPITAIWVMPWAVLAVALLPFGLEAVALTPMGIGIDVIRYVSSVVSSWPGAVGLTPTGSSLGLVAAAMGGLWLCLWRGRWRLLGIVGLFWGAISGSVIEQPDILISESGRLAAVRLDDGRYVLSSKTRDRFSGKQWLRAVGRGQADIWGRLNDGSARCDKLGCTALIKNKRVAFIWDERGLQDDCQRADIVVAAIPIRSECPAVHIDRFDLWRYGAHAIYLSDDAVIVRNVSHYRGVRPWTLRPVAKRRRTNNVGSVR